MIDRFYARNTTVKEVDNADALLFVQNNHRKGIASPGKGLRSYGLFTENDELVGVAMFCNPRTRGMQKLYTTELFRLAFKKDVRVVGGASKLIKHFLSTEPWDLFTYQDTSGENSDVYEHAGMKLVQKAKPKKILVKNGLTVNTAQDNRQDWFSMEQVITFGPDALLKTDLGEVFNEDGSRKTNVELFVDELDYHIEEVPGDNVYEWRNSNVDFYIYKITSTEKPGYYIGRHASRIDADKMNDGYMGFGVTKFQEWKSSVSKDSLIKEILSVHSTWKEILEAEYIAIGDAYKNDPLCLNFHPGGNGIVRPGNYFKMGECSIHGLTKHQGNTCSTCNSQKSVSMRDCPKHGLTKHQGDVCNTCNSQKSISTRECPVHGESKFQGGSCMKCDASRQLTTKECVTHGLVLHKGDSCTLCTAQKAVTLRECLVHGVTKHQGDVCNKCNSQKSVSMRECPKHGLTKHQGSVCNKCNSQQSVVLGDCPVHGESKFQGGVCSSCRNLALITEKDCPVHGLWKHRGNSCYACISDRRKAKKLASAV